jgi:hypothetical protein
MSYVIKVHVQLPDGTFAHCPVARYADSPTPGELKSEVVKQETPRDAAIWAKFILFMKTDIVPAPTSPIKQT